MGREDRVCVSAYDLKKKEYIRLLKEGTTHIHEYYSDDEIQTNRLIPFNRMECVYKKPHSIDPPHVEDRIVKQIRYSKTCDEQSRKRGLLFISKTTIQDIFGFLPDQAGNHRLYSVEKPPAYSLGTLRVNTPPRLFCVLDTYKQDRVVFRLTFEDQNAFELKWIKIVDLRMIHYLKWRYNSQQESYEQIQKEMNQLFRQADCIFIRLGLTRVFPTYPTAEQSRGFWLQVTGIYPFPDYLGVFDFWTYSPKN